MSAEVEELKKWSAIATELPPEDVVNRLLIGLIEWHLHPTVLKELLFKATPIDLVTKRNILGPRNHAASLVRETLQEIVQLDKGINTEAACVAQEQECNKACTTHGIESIEFGKATDGKPTPEAAELRHDFISMFMPLALCGWGTLLALLTMIQWV